MHEMSCPEQLCMPDKDLAPFYTGSGKSLKDCKYVGDMVIYAFWKYFYIIKKNSFVGVFCSTSECKGLHLEIVP